ncbi:MAG: TetR/AcrR family transcriptional regulator [Acidimicrobiales bacterium]|nr:TetR/AcrR family transcriptional regulator [Acidimicrobiales bacterium]
MATDTRQRMIRSTARLIRRQGYYGTGLNDIVAEADAPKGSLYFHFPGGKVQLAAEALDLFGTNVERMLADGIVELGSASAAVAAYLDRVADGFDTRGTGNGCAIAVVAAEAAPSEPALAEATSRALRLWTDGLTRQLVSEGHTEAQAHALATTAIAAIEGAILLGRGTGSSAPVREVRDVVATLLAAPPAAPGAAQAKTKARNTRKRTPPAK